MELLTRADTTKVKEFFFTITSYGEEFYTLKPEGTPRGGEVCTSDQ